MESHGTMLGFIPYDFRRPSLARIKERIWNPEDERIVVPRVFGAGWTLNLYQLHMQRPLLFYMFVAGAVLRLALGLRKLIRSKG